MNNGGLRPQRPQQSRDNLYARTLTRHALLQSSLSLPAPLERSPLFLSRSANSLDILPPRHRPLFAAREEEEEEAIQDTFLSNETWHEIPIYTVGRSIGRNILFSFRSSTRSVEHTQ